MPRNVEGAKSAETANGASGPLGEIRDKIVVDARSGCASAGGMLRGGFMVRSELPKNGAVEAALTSLGRDDGTPLFVAGVEFTLPDGAAKIWTQSLGDFAAAVGGKRGFSQRREGAKSYAKKKAEATKTQRHEEILRAFVSMWLYRRAATPSAGA